MPYISQINFNSRRLCAIKIINNDFITLIIINVYLPTNFGSDESVESYSEAIAELMGLIDSVTFDNLIIAGDFNVDLFRASKRTDILLSFMTELNLCAVDLACYPRVTYTYEHDNGKVTSWPDHILTLKLQSYY